MALHASFLNVRICLIAETLKKIKVSRNLMILGRDRQRKLVLQEIEQ